MEAHAMSNLERIFRVNAVLARTGLSRSTMYPKIADGIFPCRIEMNVNGNSWRESAINLWIDNPIGYREPGVKR
jgi:prophage regulatory protein